MRLGRDRLFFFFTTWRRCKPPDHLRDRLDLLDRPVGPGVAAQLDRPQRAACRDSSRPPWCSGGRRLYRRTGWRLAQKTVSGLKRCPPPRGATGLARAARRRRRPCRFRGYAVRCRAVTYASSTSSRPRRAGRGAGEVVSTTPPEASASRPAPGVRRDRGSPSWHHLQPARPAPSQVCRGEPVSTRESGPPASRSNRLHRRSFTRRRRIRSAAHVFTSRSRRSTTVRPWCAAAPDHVMVHRGTRQRRESARAPVPASEHTTIWCLASMAAPPRADPRKRGAIASPPPPPRQSTNAVAAKRAVAVGGDVPSWPAVVVQHWNGSTPWAAAGVFGELLSSGPTSRPATASSSLIASSRWSLGEEWLE